MEVPSTSFSMLSKRSLGDQLDAWCEMLAAASAAVGVGPGGRAGPPGVVSPVHGLHVPRPPDVPRPIGRVRDGQAYVLNPGHLTGLTLPHSAKPPTGQPPPNSNTQTVNKTSRTVIRKRSIKKSPARNGTTSKDDTRKKHKTKGKGRTRSRTQSYPDLVSTGLSSKSDSWTNVSSIGNDPQHSAVLSGGSGLVRGLISRPSPTLNHQAGVPVLSTVQVSETESDISDSDKSEAEEDASRPNLLSAPVGLNRATERRTCNFNCINSNDKDGADFKEVTTKLPQHNRCTHSHCDRPVSVSHGALSPSTSNLTKLPDVVLTGDLVPPALSQSSSNRSARPKQLSSTLSHGKVCPIDTKSSEVVERFTEKKKRPPRPSIISLVKPLNQEAEKAKFLSSRNYEYNPQFQYKSPVDQSAHKKYFKPEYKLMPLALKVLQNVLCKHGSYEKFAKRSGGRELNRDQILELVNNYLKGEGLEDEVLVKLSTDLVSRACMTRVKGRPLLQVQINNVHEGWMDGLLRHEIGTHYLRSCNNSYQLWRRPRKRRELEMDHQNPTEEGLASLHSVIFREDPSMWRAAMLYYTVARASDLSFSALFHDLAKFARDPNVRWDYCLRAKRGFVDTSDPGAFTKDQVYLKGALEILKNRGKIDFHALLRMGKVSYRDVDRLMGAANFHHTRIPRFMRDLDHYHKKLDEILLKNGLTDADLDHM